MTSNLMPAPFVYTANAAAAEAAWARPRVVSGGSNRRHSSVSWIHRSNSGPLVSSTRSPCRSTKTSAVAWGGLWVGGIGAGVVGACEGPGEGAVIGDVVGGVDADVNMDGDAAAMWLARWSAEWSAMRLVRWSAGWSAMRLANGRPGPAVTGLLLIQEGLSRVRPLTATRWAERRPLNPQLDLASDGMHSHAVWRVVGCAESGVVVCCADLSYGITACCAPCSKISDACDQRGPRAGSGTRSPTGPLGGGLKAPLASKSRSAKCPRWPRWPPALPVGCNIAKP